MTTERFEDFNVGLRGMLAHAQVKDSGNVLYMQTGKVKPSSLAVLGQQQCVLGDQTNLISPLSGCQKQPDLIIIEGELMVCQYGYTPTHSGSKPSESWTRRYFQLKGSQLLVSDDPTSRQDIFCILNSGYLIRGQTAGIISIFNPGKSKISLKASSDEECQKWVTCLRRASVGYRTEEAMIQQFNALKTNSNQEEIAIEDEEDEDDEDDDLDERSVEQMSTTFNGQWTGPSLIDGIRNGEGRYQIDHLIFEGQWHNDMLNGFGIMIDLMTGMRYTGSWRHNCQHGRGELQFGNGDQYVGDFFNGRILGSGVFTQSSNSSSEIASNQYRGQFCDGNIMGYGRMFWSGGDYYEGYFRNGVAHGQGRLTYSDIGEIHIGTWIDGWISGQCEIQFVQSGTRFEGDFGDGSGSGRSGVLFMKDGGRYEGQVSGEYRHGQGTMIWNDGTVYAGSWENDEMSGDGIYTQSQTSLTYSGHFLRSVRSGFGELNFGRRRYIGNWDDDLASGNGVMVYSNGNVYDGDWVQGQRTGFGKFLYVRAKVSIEGQWIDGKLNGKGICRLPDGTIFEGEFQDSLRNGKAMITLANGDIITINYVADQIVEEQDCKVSVWNKEDSKSSKDQKRPWRERFTFLSGATSPSTYLEGFQILSIDEEDCPFLLS